MAASGTSATAVPERSSAFNLLISLRPGQWTKNLLVFAGLLFAKRLFDAGAVADAMAAFAIFCALSGAVYLVNDIADRDIDRRHPLKARRPLASGALPVGVAAGAAVVLFAGGLVAAFLINRKLGWVSAGYLALLVFYSTTLKHIVILDVLTIAIGFVLRAVAGAFAIDVEISQWLLVCTILLALFIALAKRRHELVLLADGATGHRPILGEVQRLSAGPDDCGGHGIDARRLHFLHDQSRDAGEVRDGVAPTDDSISDLRDFPVPLPGAPP